MGSRWEGSRWWELSAGDAGVGREHRHPLVGGPWAANYDPPGGVELRREATGQLRLRWQRRSVGGHHRCPAGPPARASWHGDVRGVEPGWDAPGQWRWGAREWRALRVGWPQWGLPWRTPLSV